MKFPNIYITSTEVEPTLQPRKCKIIKPLWSNERKTYFYLVRMDRPIRLDFSEEKYEIVIAPRHLGVKIIEEIKTHPLVFICFIKNYKNLHRGTVEAADLKFFIIGEIYESEVEAEKAIKGNKNII
jgi:hypothetical protein